MAERLPRALSRPAAVLALALFAAAAAFQHPVEYDNTLSRFLLLSAVVDHGRLDLGPDAGETIDTSSFGGRVYSNKAIGAPLFAAPAYWALRRLTPLGSDPPLSPRLRRLVTLWASALPFALSGALLFLLLSRLGLPARQAYAGTLAYAFGTLTWLHASLFSGHALAAALALAAFAAAQRGSGLAAGLLAGGAVLSDYMAAPAAAAVMWLAWRKGALRAALECGAGALIASAPLLAYNAACFGSPLTLSYARLGFGGFAEGASRGLLGIGLPSPAALVSLMVSPARGLFFTMPILVFALPGLAAWRRERPAEAAAIALAAGGALLMNAGFYGWHGGWTFGPRYLTAVLPLLALAAARGLDRAWFWPLLALSAFQTGAAQFVTPHVSEHVMNPLVDTLLPLWGAGYGAIAPLGPLLLAAAAGLAAAAWPRDGAGLPKGTKAAHAWAACAFAAVALGLALARSPAAYGIPKFNARLLRDAARTLGSIELWRAAEAEEARVAR